MTEVLRNGETVKITSAEPAKPTRQRFCVMMILFVTVVINYLDRSNLSIVAPRLAYEMHLAPKMLGVTLSAFGWMYALLQIPASRLVDRMNPRSLYAATLALWSLGFTRELFSEWSFGGKFQE